MKYFVALAFVTTQRNFKQRNIRCLYDGSKWTVNVQQRTHSLCPYLI